MSDVVSFIPAPGGAPAPPVIPPLSFLWVAMNATLAMPDVTIVDLPYNQTVVSYGSAITLELANPPSSRILFHQPGIYTVAGNCNLFNPVTPSNQLYMFAIPTPFQAWFARPAGQLVYGGGFPAIDYYQALLVGTGPMGVGDTLGVQAFQFTGAPNFVAGDLMIQLITPLTSFP